MGKYMRKPTLTNNTPPAEHSQSTLGVRTRAKTLAIQTLQSSSSTFASKDSKPDYCYLQLRSRRLEKPSVLSDPTRKDSRGFSSGCVLLDREDRSSRVEGGSVGLAAYESRESGTTESTPCSCIMDADTTPCSSSTASDLRQQDASLTHIPSKRDIDEFFAFNEMQQQLLFIERYNFDVKNDIPLSGRYEWVKIHQ